MVQHKKTRSKAMIVFGARIPQVLYNTGGGLRGSRDTGRSLLFVVLLSLIIALELNVVFVHVQVYSNSVTSGTTDSLSSNFTISSRKSRLGLALLITVAENADA